MTKISKKIVNLPKACSRTARCTCATRWPSRTFAGTRRKNRIPTILNFFKKKEITNNWMILDKKWSIYNL